MEFFFISVSLLLFFSVGVSDPFYTPLTCLKSDYEITQSLAS